MRDILPAEATLRRQLETQIYHIYAQNGFAAIDTPAVEHLELLTGGQGGENEKLIYKILKRGDKLDLDAISDASSLCDLGLRFDLTVPLARYFANNRGQLPSVFKAIQMAPV